MTPRTQFLEGWLASEEAALDVITVKRIYIDINDGNLHDGLMFSQIMYWHGNSKETGKPRMTITRDGELWLAKSYTDWWDECRINEHTARKSINRIAERQLIVTNLWKFDGAPTVHLRIDWQVFESRVKSIWYSVSNPIDTTGQMDAIPQVNSLTETTATTTTDKPLSPFVAMKNAIHAAFGYDKEKTADATWTLIGKAASQLLKAGATPSDMKGLHKYCADRFDNFKAMALATNWSEYQKAHPQSATAFRADELPQYVPSMDTVSIPAYDDPTWSKRHD